MSLLARLKCSHKTFDIVKIDTQGSEKDIIVGGRRNWNGDVDQMMTYQVSEADYTRYTGASK